MEQGLGHILLTSDVCDILLTAERELTPLPKTIMAAGGTQAVLIFGVLIWSVTTLNSQPCNVSRDAYKPVQMNDTLHEALYKHGASRRTNRAHKNAVVISNYRDFDAGVPTWLAKMALDPLSPYVPIVYQRTQASSPRYSPNIGGEGAVFVQYVYEHYHNLPNITVFLHPHPEAHATGWQCYLSCIRPNASYINFNSYSFTRRTVSGSWGDRYYAAWVEQCWRDIAVLADAPFAPKEDPSVTAPCCAQFIASREQLHRRPYSFWAALMKKIYGNGGLCHTGPLDLDDLYIVPGKDGVNDSHYEPHVVDHGRHTIGGAMEHMTHIIFGLQPHQGNIPSQTEFCDQFYPASVCPGSPCST